MAPHKRTTMLTTATQGTTRGATKGTTRGATGTARGATRVATLGLGGAAVALLPGVGMAAPAPAPQNPADAAKAQISQLYQQAEAATQTYDAAQERINGIQAVLAGQGAEAAALRAKLATLSGGLGRLAAQQYRDSGVDPAVSLMFASHPDSYLAESELVSQNAAEEQRQLRSVNSDQQALTTLDDQAGLELSELRAQQQVLAATRTDIQGRLAEARRELDQLGRAERAKVAAALADGDDGDGLGTTVPAVAPSLGSLLDAVVTEDADEPDGSLDVTRALKAVSAAYAELGKPYVWGATGPADFDCSGLTQHVWAAAGVALPRTSEEQADAGPEVPVDQIEPGDLVVYFSGRTHVGVYVGEGRVIHAPRPGSEVQFANLDSMPINKVVRPTG